MTHHLTEKDPSTRTAVCSVDGSVKMYRAGRGWVCATKQNARASAAQKRRGRRTRRPSENPHRLTYATGSATAQSAICSLDGAVDLVPWGRGWICPVRARELGRVHQQDEPQPFCRDCQAADGTRVWLLADGSCPRCQEIDLGRELSRLAADQRSVPEDVVQAGLHIVGLGDPYEMPDYESAVPGWRTIA